MTEIQKSVLQRGITRLCHFTSSRNLAHISNDPMGVRASQQLEADENALFNPTDKDRLDGYADHVCCSIQYPNAWYFQQARTSELLFLDWIVLLVDPHYLWQTGTKFCPRNAAAAYGRLVREGVEAFDALFADVIKGVRCFRRGPYHPNFLPTDEQAEVLIPGHIRYGDVTGIVVRDDEQAAREISRLELQNLNADKIIIVPEFFNPRALSQQLRYGRIPEEREYHRGDTHV